MPSEVVILAEHEEESIINYCLPNDRPDIGVSVRLRMSIAAEVFLGVVAFQQHMDIFRVCPAIEGGN